MKRDLFELLGDDLSIDDHLLVQMLPYIERDRFIKHFNIELKDEKVTREDLLFFCESLIYKTPALIPLDVEFFNDLSKAKFIVLKDLLVFSVAYLNHFKRWTDFNQRKRFERFSSARLLKRILEETEPYEFNKTNFLLKYGLRKEKFLFLLTKINLKYYKSFNVKRRNYLGIEKQRGEDLFIDGVNDLSDLIERFKTKNQINELIIYLNSFLKEADILDTYKLPYFHSKLITSTSKGSS